MTRKKETLRRGDEESLYYILERDLDRGALFPENDGWLPQVKTMREHNFKIDYVLEYDSKLIGIEVKYDFPRESDFAQVKDEYVQSLNAAFLAYPSDRVGEAIQYVEGNNDYKKFGLISIALFRSHCIRKAKMRQTMYSDYTWKEYFDKERISASLGDASCWHYVPKEERRHVIVELKKKQKSILKEIDWQMLGLFFCFYDIFGYNKYLTWEGKNGFENCFNEIFGKYPPYPYGLIYADLVVEQAYGSMLTTYGLSDAAIYYRSEIESNLKSNFSRTLAKIEKVKPELKRRRRIGQKEGIQVFLET